jgi:glutamate synthase (NADPH/NADH) large chain
LYIARKQIEQYAERQDLGLYFTSLSHKTIVYKGSVWMRTLPTRERIRTKS